MKMKSVADVFGRARKARIAVLGIGSILSGDSSYYDLHPTSRSDRAKIEKAGAPASFWLTSSTATATSATTSSTPGWSP